MDPTNARTWTPEAVLHLRTRCSSRADRTPIGRIRIPPELSHDPPQPFDYAYRWPFRRASDPGQWRGGRHYDEGGDVARGLRQN